MPKDKTPEAQTEEVTPFTFPFEIPDNFASLDDDELQDLVAQIVEHSSEYTKLQPQEHTDPTLEALNAFATLADQATAEMRGRASRAQKASAAAGSLDKMTATAAPLKNTPTARTGEDTTEDGGEDTTEDGSTTDGAPKSVTAARGRIAPPSVRQIAKGTRAPHVPNADRSADRSWATMAAAADVPGFQSGQTLTSFEEASRALAARVDQYPTASPNRRFNANKRPVTAYDPDAPGRRLQMRNYSRQNAVQFRRSLPEELRVHHDRDGYRVAEFAANERRLYGNSLLESAKNAIKRGKSITAAAAWCAASEVIYELCELESMDGMLSVPELQTSRGGWQIPQNGGPDFSAIWNGIGNSGDTHLSETQVQEDTAKVCTEIPCPDFDDIRLGVDYVCLTGGLLQRRGYPEIVARFARGAMVALAHKMNQGLIADIATASGAAIPISQIPNGDDAASALLSAIELGIIDMKYRNRMPFSSTVEAITPMWFLGPIRAGLARRRGVKALDVTDAEIMEWFTIRRAVPQFVYDWQDAYTGLATGPGGATSLEAFPSTGEFLLYPAGTWVKAVQDVVSLDTIYDSTNLQTNQYTAIFAEDGWAPLQMCPDTRRYQVVLDPSGVVGCCPPELTSI